MNSVFGLFVFFFALKVFQFHTTDTNSTKILCKGEIIEHKPFFQLASK